METKILRISEIPTVNAEGAIVRRRVVTYMVGEHGPFQLEIPAAQFDPLTVRAKLEEEAQKLRQLFGA